MKRWLIVLMMLVSQNAFADSVSVGGGWSHTNNSNYGDSALFLARYEKAVYGPLGIGLEGSYHGPQSHNHDIGSYGDMSGWSAIPYIVVRPEVDWQVKPYGLAGYGYSWWTFDRSQDMADKGIAIDMGDTTCFMLATGLETQIKGILWAIELSYFQAQVPLNAYYESNGSFANVVGDDDRSGRRRIGQPEIRIMLIGRKAW